MVDDGSSTMEMPMVECPYCHKEFHKKGSATHQKACQEEWEMMEDEARFIANRQRQRQSQWVMGVGGCT